MKQIINCSNCNKEKEVKIFPSTKTKNHFCNKQCKAEWQKINLVGKLNHFFNKKHDEKTLKHLKENAKERFSIPENNPMFGKKHTKKTLLRMRKVKWKKESNHRTFFKTIARKKMEKHLGRKLTSKEIVHHLDHNQRNNKIENLYVFNSQAEHTIYHRKKTRFVRDYFEEIGLNYKWNANTAKVEIC